MINSNKDLKISDFIFCGAKMKPRKIVEEETASEYFTNNRERSCVVGAIYDGITILKRDDFLNFRYSATMRYICNQFVPGFLDGLSLVDILTNTEKYEENPGFAKFLIVLDRIVLDGICNIHDTLVALNDELNLSREEIGNLMKQMGR